MSKVGNWAMDMQEDAFSLLNAYTKEEARKLFQMKNVGQEGVFEDCLRQWDGPQFEGE